MEKTCQCPIRPNMSYQQLMDEVVKPRLNCCDPKYMCPNLASELHRARKALGYGEAAEKKLENPAPKQQRGIPSDLKIRRSFV